jgi:putative membrane protein
MMWFGGGGWWMFFSMLLFWGGLIALIVWAVRAASDRPTYQRGNRALEILEERYDRGEIDYDEFDERRRTLEQG